MSHRQIQGGQTMCSCWLYDCDRPVAALVTGVCCTVLAIPSYFAPLSDALSSTRKKGYEQKSSLLQEVSC